MTFRLTFRSYLLESQDNESQNVSNQISPGGLDNIKRDLGNDALILSSRAVPHTRGFGFLTARNGKSPQESMNRPHPPPLQSVCSRRFGL